MEIFSALGGGLWTLIAFIVALSVIVAVHEYGHYIVGRWCGIRAEVFSIGFGPRLVSWRDRRGTEWQVAAIPLGGYVKFLGDADAASAGPGRAVSPEFRRQTLDGAPLWARAATVGAGPLFNFILSTLIFAGSILLHGVAVATPTVGALAPMPPGMVSELRPGDEILGVGGHPVSNWGDLYDAANGLAEAPAYDWRVRRDGAEMTVPGPNPAPPVVGGIQPSMPAARAGLKPGDVLTAIDGEKLVFFQDIARHVAASEGAPMQVSVIRDGTPLAVTLSARLRDLPRAEDAGGGYEQRWLIGLSPGGYIEPMVESRGPLGALMLGLARVWDIIASSMAGLWAMISGQIGTCNIGGAITIAE
ncbi:MAG: RIP metalloprotease RseP, partial [Paracoccus sp. (in: a-proteobacteria)]|nr:RIP metalloprotease RseP [Paracoccus sp. (in: a-proteobacteria)]